jgi:RNA polymerase sigma factor (sigma-70 family)
VAGRREPAVDAETDDRLMVAVQAGDLSRLGDLFERHHRALFQFFLRLTGDPQASEDLVQDVFLRMLRYRATYQPGSQMRTWMYRLARNAHIDRYHSRSPEASLEDQALLEPASAAPGAADLLQHEEQTDLLRRALARLPPDKRELLLLSRFQGLSYPEIATVLGCEVGTVKVRVFRAVRALRAIFLDLAGESHPCPASN